MNRFTWAALGAMLVAACAAAQSNVEVQNAAIVAGCKESEVVVLGEAGAPNEAADMTTVKAGCTTALRAWDLRK